MKNKNLQSKNMSHHSPSSSSPSSPYSTSVAHEHRIQRLEDGFLDVTKAVTSHSEKINHLSGQVSDGFDSLSTHMNALGQKIAPPEVSRSKDVELAEIKNWHKNHKSRKAFWMKVASSVLAGLILVTVSIFIDRLSTAKRQNAPSSSNK